MLDTEAHRARSLEEFRALQGRMLGPDDVMKATAAYRPRPTDVIISPFGKCGTTWLQQTFHCLRTGGDMVFDDISRMVPWIETSGLLGIDLDAPQRAEPRGFKSHLPYPALPAGARHIVSFRDPKDALVSMHKFMEGWFLEPGAVSVEDFATAWLGRDTPTDYWTHLLSWWDQRDNPDVLMLSYEHMTADPGAGVRRVADFCGLMLNDELFELTLEHISLAFMLRHKDRFDDLMMREVSERMCGLPSGSDSAKVRRGGVGGYRQELPAEVSAAVDERWTRVVTPATGMESYAAFEAAVRARAA